MKHTYKDGVILTQTKIDQIIDSIPKDRVDDVMNAWNEFTPFICLCWRQILGYIISAFPEAAYEDEACMVEKLLTGPEPISNRWAYGLEAAIALDEMRRAHLDATVDKLQHIMDEKMHCPDVYKRTEDWLVIMALHEIITEVPLEKSSDLFTEVNLWLDEISGGAM